MIDFGYYLLKVCVCSGILYCYYYMSLRNRKFHAWNRFYLLATVVVSLLLPLVKIHVNQPAETYRGAVVQLLNATTAGDDFMQEAIMQPAYLFPVEQAVIMSYTLLCVFMLGVLVKAFIYIHKLIRIYPVQQFEDFCFVNTDARGTPFSFFKYVFWNRQVEPTSETGQQMLSHELVHVKEKHTYDKIFINLVLIIFWSNPLFWLIRREMSIIHEFIADQRSVRHGDTKAFASMILHSLFPQKQLEITNYFFHSPLKRRLSMLTKISNPHSSYISRLLVLPLVIVLIAAFSFKIKNHEPQKRTFTTNEEPFTVLIDAGHGGDDNGAMTEDGFFEKDLTLEISKKVKKLNTNPNLRILLTREKDESQSIIAKADIALSQKPGAFISIHLDAAAPVKTKSGNEGKGTSGFSIYLSAKNTALESKNILLGSFLTEELSKSYVVDSELRKRKEGGIWILDAPGVNYPAVLVECGYITNKADFAFIKDEKNQEKIARNILDALQRFAESKDVEFENPGRSPRLNSGNVGAADTIIEIIEHANAKKVEEFKKKAASFLNISETEIQKVQFKRVWTGGKVIRVATIVRLQDKTTKEISEEDSRKIGIPIPASPRQDIKYKVTMNQNYPVQKLVRLRNLQSKANQVNQQLSQLKNPTNMEGQMNQSNNSNEQIQPNQKMRY